MTSFRLGSLVPVVEGAWPIPDTWCSRTSSVKGREGCRREGLDGR